MFIFALAWPQIALACLLSLFLAWIVWETFHRLRLVTHGSDWLLQKEDFPIRISMRFKKIDEEQHQFLLRRSVPYQWKLRAPIPPKVSA
jgi:hypothetical protein